MSENSLLNEPYDFNKTTITVTVQILPEEEDGDRQVVLAVFSHGEVAVYKFTRWSELAPLPDPMQAALDEFRRDLPARQIEALKEKAGRKTRKSSPDTGANGKQKTLFTEVGDE